MDKLEDWSFIITKYINSNVIYFLSTSLLISLTASIIFKLFENNVFTSPFCAFFYLIFYLFPVFIGYTLANKMKLLENDIEALTAYDKSIYSKQDNVSGLQEMREEKKKQILDNSEYHFIGVKIVGCITYILYVLGFTIYIISKGYLNI